MKIDNANIILASQHQATQRHTVKESLRVRVGDQQTELTQTQLQERREAGYEVSLSNTAQLSRQESAASAVNEQSRRQSGRVAAPAKKSDAPVEELDEAPGDPKLRMLKLLLKKMFGVTVENSLDKDLAAAKARADKAQSKAAEPVESEAVTWGLEYNRQEQYYEAEQTEFSAVGVINTADGQQIEFKLNLSMSREFMVEHNLNIRLGEITKDPLVINFEGTAAQLTDSKFTFDLDADGRPDQISFVTPNSGFLALDKNGDGVINDGRELFGPNSGNGFQELEAYDQDGNQWIDERDQVFDQLQVWVKDAAGQDRLVSLAEQGIGAIYLQPTRSEFSVKDQQNELLAQVRSSSIYANEDGTVGTVQQLDLAV